MHDPNPNHRESQRAKERDKKHNPFSVEEVGMEYNHTEAQFMAMLMKKLMQEHNTEFVFVQQHLCHKGTKTFGKKGKKWL